MKWIKGLFQTETPVFIEIRGRNTLLAEGYCRIECYLPEKITLANDDYSFDIIGSNLELRHLSDGIIAVDGRIDSVAFI